ncbi:ankyrin repeat domain-containing protein [Pandoraea sp.]|uniref:ankyrin repeat domain-containing protein n=1 Tax=Pandoraea sp. TaxID=1883445 RepID=UPI0025ED1F75|nr:ankyrin repeat domain-containing protein [Pandoraea sp.]
MTSREEIAEAQTLVLVDAIQSRHEGLVGALIEAGVDVNRAGEQGAPLAIAGAGRSVEIVRMLLDAGAAVEGVDDDGWTALERAAYGDCGACGDDEMVRVLIDAGAALETALMLAAGSGDVEIVRMLLDAGANPIGTTREKGMTALGWAEECERVQEEALETAGMLRAAVCEMLLDAVRREDVGAVKEVVAAGAGEAALIAALALAEANKHEKIIAVLVMGVDGLLIAAARRGDQKAVGRLKPYASDVACQKAEDILAKATTAKSKKKTKLGK